MTPAFAVRIGFMTATLCLSGSGLACDPSSAQNSEGVFGPEPVDEANPRLPGFESVDPALEARLRRALQDRGPAYIPRTRHLRSDGSPEYTNRLIEASNPYLLQHAHNPVSWYPWSKEAFERAKRESKPIFLSIGYATCHWCHVMERESFEDEEIAAFLNRHFVSIKVDREERPDVDSVYMTAVNLLTGRGGWPMTIIMTPDKEPFFGGTYLPPRRGVRGARVGLIEILTEMMARYHNDPASVVAHAQEVSQQVQRMSLLEPGPGVPSDKTIVMAATQLASRFDRVDGGFAGAPKFPEPSKLTFLLRYARRARDKVATAMVTTTLDRMAGGGMYDHVGGGFHRYSTDSKWILPHFEKMLYDNAQLARLYLEAWQHTENPEYARVSREILDYVAREMTSPAGGFYSATDADSRTSKGNEEEGRFFTWTPAELQRALAKDDAALVSAAFGVTDSGNHDGRSVLYRAKSNERLAIERGTSVTHIESRLTAARAALYAARARRPPPSRDDKVIAAWNGLMISAFAQAGWALEERRFVDAASRAAHFVLDSMRDDAGRLVRTWHRGVKSSVSFLDDYAFMVGACLDLYQATGALAWLEAASELQGEQDARFSAEGGGYFLTPDDGEHVLVRHKPIYDGAIPAGNSIAAHNLLRLHDFTGNQRWRASAEKLLASVSLHLTRVPTGSPLLLSALDRYYDVPLEIAIVSMDSRDESRSLEDRLRVAFVPNKVVAVLTESEAAFQKSRVPWLEAKRPIGGKPTAYVCQRGRCELPTSSPGVFAKQLTKRTPYPSFEHRPPDELQLERQRP